MGTTSWGEKANFGYISEGIACYLPSELTNKTLPLYYNGKEHFYTAAYQEIGTITYGETGYHGYVCEGIAGYVFKAQEVSTVPLLRYNNGKEHFYTTNGSEIGTVICGQTGKGGYTCEHGEGFVYYQNE